MIKMDLNGLWDFVIDLDPKYHNDPVIHPNPSYADPNWDRRHWLKVAVPGVWNKYAEKLDIYEGVCWFAREFALESLPEDPAAFLRFGAVNYKCRVFLNGKFIGTHEGGYTEFVFDVSAHLVPGKNFLAVEVDNRAAITKLPPCLGYFNYGGIHRDVTLEIHSGSYLENLVITACDEHLRVTCDIRRPESRLEMRITCGGYENHEYMENPRDRYETDLYIPQTEPWSPDNPVLHPVTIQLRQCGKIFHEFSYQVGFRKIEMADGKILLNGQSIFLKGICYLYDSPAYGLTMKPEQFLTDIALLKEMGVNTIRSHFPFTREFYEACDRAGIMIWIETPVYCLHPDTSARDTIFSNPEFVNLANSMIEEMIRHARPHPSVVIYSVGNECNVENPEAEAFFNSLCRKVRTLDDTRLLSYASLYCIVGPLADFVDILGINEYWGWYDKDIYSRGPSEDQEAKTNRQPTALEPIDLAVLKEKLNELKTLHKKPMLLTEFGADSVPNYLSASRNLWSEEYHADLIKETYAVLEQHPEIRGVFPFCFCDYRDPSKQVNIHWDYMNYKGVVTYERRPKKAFYALKSLYRKGQ